MNTKRNRRSLALGLVVPALLALLPMLAISGGIATTAQAGVKPALSTVGAAQQEQILVLRVYFADIAERDRLATQIGAEESSTRGGYLTKWADRATYDAMLAAGLRVQIDQEQTRLANMPIQWNKDSPNPDTFYGGYLTVEEMYTFMDQKVAANPTLVEKIDIGDSWCKTHLGQCTQPNAWNGFDLYVLHITNRNIPGPKPAFWYDAGIHSREIATPEVARRFISYLLDNYNTDADAHWLVDYHDIWVMPMLNPDGHHMNESGGNNPTLHRKNADRDDGCTTYDQFGTDINRNFPFVWGCCGGSSSNACSDIYRGPAQNSEEETQAIVAKVRSLIPDQRGPAESDPAPITTTGTLINMHSNAALNLYPWGYTEAFAPNRTDMRNIGKHMSALNVFPPGNNYAACQNTDPNCLYIVDGDEKNWIYGELGSPGYSLELAGSNFFPAYPCLDNPPGVNGCTDPDPGIGLGLWPQNRGALLYHSKISRAPYLLTRGPDAYTSTSTPITVTLGSSAVVTGTINYNWTGNTPVGPEPNSYLQNVATAEYYIDTPPWAGGTGVPMTPVDGTYNSPTEAVQASINTGSLSPGRHIVFVRGRGVNDYEGHQSWGAVSAVFVDVIPAGTVTPSPTGGTSTAVPPTITSIPTVPSSSTPVVPSATATPIIIISTNTPVGATNTAVVSTSTPVGATATTTPCTVSYSDVPTTNTFYPYVRCLACKGIIGGYSDGTFRPNNAITRGQLSKIVASSAGFNEPVSGQTFEDVEPDNTFYQYIERMASRGIIGGYPCGGAGEPCGTTNRPYFRPNANATRGQISKIVSEAAGFDENHTTQTFEDVPTTNTFYIWIERLASRFIMGGYPCGTVAGEPCGPGNRAYFRWGNTSTRGQVTKIVSGAFFPNCDPAGR
jgi:carboxypeptidase T